MSFAFDKYVDGINFPLKANSIIHLDSIDPDKATEFIFTHLTFWFSLFMVVRLGAQNFTEIWSEKVSDLSHLWPICPTLCKNLTLLTTMSHSLTSNSSRSHDIYFSMMSYVSYGQTYSTNIYLHLKHILSHYLHTLPFCTGHDLHI